MKNHRYLLKNVYYFHTIPFPLKGYSDKVTIPPCTYARCIHLNDIININIIPSYCHHQHQHQHQHHLILLSSSTSTSSQGHQHHKQSHSTYIRLNSCLGFSFPRSSYDINHIIIFWNITRLIF